jgi:hypothetical protein
MYCEYLDPNMRACEAFADRSVRVKVFLAGDARVCVVELALGREKPPEC